MKKAIPKSKKHGGKRDGAGRPATGRDPVRTFRLSDEHMVKLDTLRGKQSRSEALRRLIDGATTKR